MLQTLKIHVSRFGKGDLDTKVSIPLTMIKTSEKLLPVKLKELLNREGINIAELEDCSGKKGPKGVLIEIENVNEKLTIMLE